MSSTTAIADASAPASADGAPESRRAISEGLRRQSAASSATAEPTVPPGRTTPTRRPRPASFASQDRAATSVTAGAATPASDSPRSVNVDGSCLAR